MKLRTKIIVLSLLIVAVIASVLYGFRNKIMDLVDPTGYVATLGTKKITTEYYNYFLMSAKNSIEQNAGVQTDADKKALWQSAVGNQTAAEYAKEQALNSSILYTILSDKAKASNYKLDETEIKTANEQVEGALTALGTGDAANKAFQAQYGLTPEKLKAVNLDLALAEKYYNEEMKKVTATDEELKKFYDENAETYEKVTVKHVLLMTIDSTTNEPLPQDKQDAAKKKAEEVLAKVKSGANIADLAKQYSEDPGSKDSGGEYTFGKGEMVKEFEDWAFAAKPGDVGIVKTSYGYHVMKFEKKLGFEDLKETIKSNFVGKKFNEQVEQWKNSTEYTLKRNEQALTNIKVMD